MDHHEMPPLLINSQTAAQLLGISTRNLWQLSKDGQIPTVKIGKLKRYYIPSLKKWIEENSIVKGN